MKIYIFLYKSSIKKYIKNNNYITYFLILPYKHAD